MVNIFAQSEKTLYTIKSGAETDNLHMCVNLQ